MRWYLFSTDTYLLKTNALLQYDGATSVNCPPSTPTFDPISHKSSLRLHHPEPDVPSNAVSASGDLEHSPTPPQSMPPNKRVTFEKRYHGGGSYRLYGPKITEAEGDLPPNTDFDWHYFCKVRNAMVPLPFGYVSVLDGENDL